MCKCQMCMFNVTCTNVGVNMVVFLCVLAALLPLVGVGVAVAEARRARRRAMEARDRVMVLEMVRTAVHRPFG
jgi:hypothetical protein